MSKALVLAAIAASGAFMATGWLAHLRYKDSAGFLAALLVSWAVVLPEYALNVWATRAGVGDYTGLQMASVRLCAGAACIAAVSRFVLREPWSPSRALGLAFVAVGAALSLRA